MVSMPNSTSCKKASFPQRHSMMVATVHSTTNPSHWRVNHVQPDKDRRATREVETLDWQQGAFAVPAIHNPKWHTSAYPTTVPYNIHSHAAALPVASPAFQAHGLNPHCRRRT